MTNLQLETQTPTDLALLQQEVGAIVNADTPLNTIGERLGQLYDQTTTDTQRQIISQAWEDAQALARVANNAFALSQSAVAVAIEMRDQRDLIADEFADMRTEFAALEEAVENADTDHPAVAQLYETVVDLAHDNIIRPRLTTL